MWTRATAKGLRQENQQGDLGKPGRPSFLPAPAFCPTLSFARPICSCLPNDPSLQCGLNIPQGGPGGCEAPRAQHMTQSRLVSLDIARTAALLGMVCFHLVFDLQMFGHLPYGTTATPFFYWHARLVAGSFIFLSGVSLWLAHGAGLHWPAFWRRWIKLAAAAALVSAATYAAFPAYFVYFGILHSLALSSLVGVMFLRLPALATAAAGVAVMAASYHLPSDAFNAPLLRFLGLAAIPAETIDFEPVFPWVGPFLLGLAAARLASRLNLWPAVALPDRPWIRALAWPGRHSLMIYLLHQPVLMGVIWAATRLSS